MPIKYLNPDDIKMGGPGPEDVAKAAAGLLRLVYREKYYDPDLQSEIFVSHLEKKIKSGESLPFLALDGKKIIASSFLEIDRARGRAELAKSVVHKNYRRTDIGKTLMRMRLPYLKRRTDLNLCLAYVMTRAANPAAIAITLEQKFIPVSLWFGNPVRNAEGGIACREPLLTAEYYLGPAYETPNTVFTSFTACLWVDYVRSLTGKLPLYQSENEALPAYHFDEKSAVHYFTNTLPDKKFTARREEEVALLFDISRDTLLLQLEAQDRGFSPSGYLPALPDRPPCVFLTRGGSRVLPAVFPAGNYDLLSDSISLLMKKRRLVSNSRLKNI